MNHILKLIISGLAVLMTMSLSADLSLLDVQHRWANANYELEEDAQIEAFKVLVSDIETQLDNGDSDVDMLIWLGITKSTLAGAEGGLGALDLAEQAKDALEKAIAINEQALDGSAYTSLGTLYHNVPGWPIGFGSDKKAKEMFKKALDINPAGIDPNYFYGEFLYNKRKYKTARKHLVKAQSATPRLERPVADKGRQDEIVDLLRKVDKKLR